MKIVFVCTGNTCRSPMAEKIADKFLADNPKAAASITVSSAGIAAFPGSRASQPSMQVMSEFGADLSGHQAREFSIETAEEADLILTMTSGHKQAVAGRFPAAAGKVFTLAELVGGGAQDINDPYGQSVEVYRESALQLQELIAKALHKILNQTLI